MTAYKEITTKSTITAELLAYALYSDWSKWVRYYSFDAIELPKTYIQSDPFLAKLASKRKFRAGILRMAPGTCYNWHVDTDRNATINMLLHVPEGLSHCLFLDDEFGLTIRIQELVYEPDTYYVFNTQVLHMVTNLQGTRFLLTLEFLDEDRDITFEQLCAEIDFEDQI